MYYVQHNTGKCVAEGDKPKPFYVIETYSDYDSCCAKSYNPERCYATGPTQPPATSSPTITPYPTTLSPTLRVAFYVDHFSGSCIDTTGRTPPHYITVVYDDYWTCCENSFQEEQCIKDGGTMIPTLTPTDVVSDMPSGEPSSVVTMGSERPSEYNGPTVSPTTQWWGAYMVCMRKSMNSYFASVTCPHICFFLSIALFVLLLQAFSATPTYRPTKEDCSGLSWHVDTTLSNGYQGCTNYDTNLDPTRPVLLFQSAEECCSYSFEALSCTVRDNCQTSDSIIPPENNMQDPQEYSCANVWHPDIDNMQDGCSNSEEFPATWYQSSIDVLFDTAQECCQSLYLDRGNHCKMYNYCSTKNQTKSPSVQPTTAQPVKVVSDYDCEQGLLWHMTQDYSK